MRSNALVRPQCLLEARFECASRRLQASHELATSHEPFEGHAEKELRAVSNQQLRSIHVLGGTLMLAGSRYLPKLSRSPLISLSVQISKKILLLDTSSSSSLSSSAAAIYLAHVVVSPSISISKALISPTLCSIESRWNEFCRPRPTKILEDENGM